MQYPPTSLIIHTDTSLNGWGGQAPAQAVQAKWSLSFPTFHINVLETLAVFLVWRKLRPAKHLHFRLVLDSQMIVHCLNGRFKITERHLRDGCHLQAGQKKGMAPLSLSSGGREECGSGLPIEVRPSGVRMVSRLSLVPVDLHSRSGSTGGSVCHRIQLQTGMLRNPKSGPSNVSVRCSVSGLERLVQHISFPPNILLTESSS